MPSNLEQMINAIETQLSLSTYVTDPNNIFAGELPAKESSPNSLFPRLEYQIHEENNYEYVNQKQIAPVDWFSVSGYLTVPANQEISDELAASVAKTRLLTIAAFFRETITNIFRMNNLKLNNTLGIDGFIQIHELYHAACYHEVLPCMDSFVFNFGIEATRPYDRE